MQSPTIPGHEPGSATHVGGPAGSAIAVARAGPGEAEAAAGISVTRRFPANGHSVGQARRFLLEELAGGAGACAEGAEDLVLILSELATNAVQHADTEFEVDITVTGQGDGRWVRVSVRDEAPGFPVPQEPPADAPHGRGLRIVASLAESWGVEIRRGRPGKTVWFKARLGAVGSAPRVAATVGGDDAARAATKAQGAIATGPWPLPGVRAVLDGLRDLGC